MSEDLNADKRWIQTWTGRRFDVIQPSPGDVTIEDIGHALSNLCRFTGHCRDFYSVAEHCVRVSFRCEELARADCAEDCVDFKLEHCDWCEDRIRHAARWGLLHDAAEAYTNDLNRPLKHQPELAQYRQIENRVMAAIADKFGLDGEPEEVGVADDELLWTEVRDLMQPLHPDWTKSAKTVREPLAHVQIACWAPSKARNYFWKRFYQLFPLTGE